MAKTSLTMDVNIKPIIEGQEIPIKKIYKDAIIPTRGSELASGWDLHAYDVVPALAYDQSANESFSAYAVNPGERVFVRTGIAVQLPGYMEAQVRPRSGLALKHGITVVNSPGTVDADYIGEIGVILLNTGSRAFLIEKGDRIAQLVFAPVFLDVKLSPAAKLKKTERGSGSFGSTGKGATE